MNSNESSDLVPRTPGRIQIGGYSDGTVQRSENARKTSAGVNYYKLLWQRKWYILFGLTLGAVAGVCRVLYQTPMYEARATLELLGFNESFMGMNQLDPQAGTGSYGASAANMQTQTRILISAALRNRVAERVNLEMPPISFVPSDTFGRARSRLGWAEREPMKLMSEAIARASTSMAARGVGLSRLIEVSCRSISPDVAASYLNTMAAEYISQTAQARSTTGLRTMQWMEGQLEETRSRLQQAESKMQEFTKKEGLAFVLDQNTLADSKLRQLQSQISTLQADRIAKQSRHELAKSSPIDSLPDILDDGTLRGLRERMTDLRREKAQLEATLMPGHQKMQRINAQLTELEQTVQREKANLVRRIQNDYEEALRRERLMLGAYNFQSHSVANQADKGAQLAGMRREVEMAQQAYNSLLQQLNQATMVSAVPAAQARVIDPAVPNPLPVEPSPGRDIGMGSILGGSLVFGGFLLLERRRKDRLQMVFSSPGHTGSLLDVPELGVIPTMERNRTERAIRIRWFGNNGPLHLNGSSRSAADNHAMVTWRERRSFQSEAFRLTLTSILRWMERGRNKVVVLTSPGPGEGKTTVACNLAIGLAEAGQKTLIVDCDLRRPRLHRIFRIENTRGLTDLVISDQPIAEILRDNVLTHETEVPGLSILPSGSSGGDELGKLLFSRRLPEIVRHLRETYDSVILDTPPALLFSDARLLGRLADGVALVVRAGMTHRESAIAVRQSLASDGISLLGIILNDWSPRDGEGDHYGQAYQRAYERGQSAYEDRR